MMRKIGLFLSICLILSWELTAFSGEIIGKGMKVGMNLADVSGDVEYNEPMTTFLFGSFFGYGFSDKIAVQGELYYVGKGFRTDGYIGDVPLDWDNKFDYFEFASLIKFFPFESGYRPHIYAGPSIAWLISAKSFNADVKENYENYDYGLIIGTGLEYPLPKGAVTFDFRYDMGLMNINNLDPPFDEEVINNNVISFIVGYSVE